MAGTPLTPKQQAFVREYLIDLNATAAYKRAGYKCDGKAATAASARMLANVSIQAAIQAATTKRAERVEVKADDVLREWLRLALSDIGHVMDFTGTDPRLRAAKDIPEDARRAIASMKVRRYTEGGGDNAREVEVTEFKFHDKLNALEKLARHIGLLKDTLEVTGKGGKDLELSDADARERIAVLESRLADRIGRSGGTSPPESPPPPV